ncbi:MAG: hypothetical protein LUC37_04250 [Prevotella sp.]|nr:hypothetical protein [Prevotella sp.]
MKYFVFSFILGATLALTSCASINHPKGSRHKDHPRAISGHSAPFQNDRHY